MLERDPVICKSIAGLTDWAAEVEGKIDEIELMVDGKTDFKLGEVITIVAFYHPDHHKLYFVRKVLPEEEKEQKLNPLSLLASQEVKCDTIRQ